MPLVFRDGDELFIQSRDLKPLNRYFPELEAPLRPRFRTLPSLDGEIVIAGPTGSTSRRCCCAFIRPRRGSRGSRARSPAAYVAWDLLAERTEDLRATPLARAASAARARRSCRVGADPPHAGHPTERALARDWFDRFEGAGLDGVVAKRLDDAYHPGKRAMVKVKHQRTADCVVARLSLAQGRPGTLRRLACCSGSTTRTACSITSASRRASPGAPRRARARARGRSARTRSPDIHGEAWRMGESGEQRMPGATSRWNRGKDLSWEPLRPERVCEVAFDHLQGTRFRHAHALPALATRQAAERMPVRSARGARARTSSLRSSPLRARVVVGVRRLRGRALRDGGRRGG